MLKMEMPGKRKRGRPEMRYVDEVREEMTMSEVTEEDAEARIKWRWVIRYGDSRREKPKEEVVRRRDRCGPYTYDMLLHR